MSYNKNRLKRLNLLKPFINSSLSWRKSIMNKWNCWTKSIIIWKCFLDKDLQEKKMFIRLSNWLMFRKKWIFRWKFIRKKSLRQMILSNTWIYSLKTIKILMIFLVLTSNRFLHQESQTLTKIAKSKISLWKGLLCMMKNRSNLNLKDQTLKETKSTAFWRILPNINTRKIKKVSEKIPMIIRINLLSWNRMLPFSWTW